MTLTLKGLVVAPRAQVRCRLPVQNNLACVPRDSSIAPAAGPILRTEYRVVVSWSEVKGNFWS